jgi:hypothetical protein
MKKVVLLHTLLLGMQVGYCQTFKEWFQQKKTQIEYLLKQIAAFQVYKEYLQKGYTIAKDGTHLIKDIKQGDVNLHNNYFSSLKSVSSAVTNYSKVTAIISHQAAVLKNFKKLLAYCTQSDQLSASEKDYIQSVYARLNLESEKDLDELLLVITSGKLEMKENERMRRIDKVYLSTLDKMSFSGSFSSDVLLLIRQRLYEQLETDRLKENFGLK